MSSLPPEIEQADAMLARVANLNLQAAEHVHACLLDTTDAEQLAHLSRAATQLSRSMRQSLALLARLRTDRAKAAREAAQHETWLKSRAQLIGAEPDAEPADLPQARHIDDVQTGVVRVIAEVAAGDRDRETALVHRFDRELDDWWDEPDFLDYNVDAVVRHACRVLDLPPDVAARWRDLPDPDWSPPRARTSRTRTASSTGRRTRTSSTRRPPSTTLPSRTAADAEQCANRPMDPGNADRRGNPRLAPAFRAHDRA